MSLALRKVLLLAGFALFFMSFSTPLQAQWNVGDVFVGVGHGNYLRYRNVGTNASPNYVLYQTISVGGSHDQTSGCAWDSQLNFYATDTASGHVFELNGASESLVQTLTTGVGTTSVMFDASGNLFVGIGSVARTKPGLLKFTPALPAVVSPPDFYDGTFAYPAVPTAAFNIGQNTDWIDLATDQKTLYLTGQTSSLQKEDLSALAPSPAAFSNLSQGAFAVRLLAPFDGSGGFLVADSTGVVKLNGAGTVLATYAFGSSRNLRALTLDANGTSAWVADFKTGNVFRFNIQTGAIEFTISTPGSSAPNGICVKGGPELNVVPLSYNPGTNVSATAKFGAPGTKDLHTWQATVDTVLEPFVLVVTSTEGIDTRRFNEYFAGLTVQPIPYADQVKFDGTAVAGKPVVYRVANPPPSTSYSGNIFFFGDYTYPSAAFYTPPVCRAVSPAVPDPRVFRAPGKESPVPPDAGNGQFAFDFTTFTDVSDNAWGAGSGSFNDYNVADRCPSNTGSSAAFLSPLPKQNVHLGSALSIAISALKASGSPITDGVTSPNNITLSITDQFGAAERVFGVPGNSPNFFKITADNKYKSNLDTSGLKAGPTTLCITSIDTSTYNNDGLLGTGKGPGEFPPTCTVVNLQ